MEYYCPAGALAKFNKGRTALALIGLAIVALGLLILQLAKPERRVVVSLVSANLASVPVHTSVRLQLVADNPHPTATRVVGIGEY